MFGINTMKWAIDYFSFILQSNIFDLKKQLLLNKFLCILQFLDKWNSGIFVWSIRNEKSCLSKKKHLKFYNTKYIDF